MAATAPAGGPDDAPPSSEMAGLEVKDGAAPVRSDDEGEAAGAGEGGADGQLGRWHACPAACCADRNCARAAVRAASAPRPHAGPQVSRGCLKWQAEQLQDTAVSEMAAARRVLLWQPLQLCARQRGAQVGWCRSACAGSQRGQRCREPGEQQRCDQRCAELRREREREGGAPPAASATAPAARATASTATAA